MKFPTYLVANHGAARTREAATSLGEVEYPNWPEVREPVIVDGKRYTILEAPANILRAEKPITFGGKKTDDGPKLDVYVYPA